MRPVVQHPSVLQQRIQAQLFRADLRQPGVNGNSILLRGRKPNAHASPLLITGTASPDVSIACEWSVSNAGHAPTWLDPVPMVIPVDLHPSFPYG
jgi:hypothetical protein